MASSFWTKWIHAIFGKKAQGTPEGNGTKPPKTAPKHAEFSASCIRYDPHTGEIIVDAEDCHT